MSRAAIIDLVQAEDLEVRRGESPYRRSIQFENFDENCVSQGFQDFTGATGKAQIRDKNGLLIASFAVSFRVDGWCDLVLTPTETLPLTRNGKWDLFVTYANGDRVLEAEGAIEIVDRVTEP